MRPDWLTAGDGTMDGVKGYPPPVVQDGQAVVDGMVISIEKIRLDNAVGEGANGFVFSGEDLWLNRPVAVKVWPPRRDRPHANNDRTDQVLAEAQKIANFKNERVATIYGVDRLPNCGWFYTVMEYIAGVPLADVRVSLNDEFGFVTRRAILS